MRLSLLVIIMVHLMSLDSMARMISPDQTQAKVPASSSLHTHWQAVLERRVEDEREIEGGRGCKEEEEGYRREHGKMGSRPPGCQHRCGGCVPCEAIEVPTITGHLQTHYANYEPEGCKCGSSFYNP